MSEKLVITFSEEATKKYLEICRASTEAHLEEDIEPAFPSLKVDLCMFDSTGYIFVGDSEVELGSVNAEIVNKDA